MESTKWTHGGVCPLSVSGAHVNVSSVWGPNLWETDAFFCCFE